MVIGMFMLVGFLFCPYITYTLIFSLIIISGGSKGGNPAMAPNPAMAYAVVN